jgi:hypothetical protein
VVDLAQLLGRQLEVRGGQVLAEASLGFWR